MGAARYGKTAALEEIRRRLADVGEPLIVAPSSEEFRAELTRYRHE